MAWVNLNTIYATKSEVNSKVPNTRTINGKALSSNVTLGASDIKLSDDTTLQSAWDSISQAKDYVIDQGVNGIWTYVKWASGRAECYGTAQHSITKTGTFWLPKVTLPFKLVKPAKSRSKFAIAVSGGEYYTPTLYPYYPLEESSISTVYCAVSGATEKGAVTVNYLVRGWWK